MSFIIERLYLSKGNTSNNVKTGTDTGRKYDVHTEKNSLIKKFNLMGKIIEFKIKPVPQNEDSMSWFKDGVNELIEDSVKNLKPNDQVGITFCSKDFLEKSPGWLAFRRVDDLKFEDVWKILESVFQSNANSMDTDTFCMNVTYVRMPIGGGRSRYYGSFKEMIKECKGVIEIKNDDNLCLPRAIVTAIAQFHPDRKYKQNVRKNIGKIQDRLSTELLSQANITIDPDGSGFSELQKFQNHLKDYRITVFKYTIKKKGTEILFKGADSLECSMKNINLLYHNNHYNVITSLTAAFCCSYYCEVCNKGYDNKKNHRCKGKCFFCTSSPPCLRNGSLSCLKCKRSFMNELCFQNHLTTNDSNSCKNLMRCTSCLKFFKSSREHDCNETFCSICKTHVDRNHFCFMQPNYRKLTYLQNKQK